ncbi:MAG: AAA family ATPase [Chloroflexota bacterium]
MFNALILENFKAFGERQVIPFAPITLIFGAISAGKSSILRALLLLKQTLDEGEDRGSVLLPSGTLADLGSFRDLVFRHDLDAVCEISPLIQADRALAASLFWGHGEALEDLPDRLGIGIRARSDRGSGKIVPASLPVYLDTTEPAYRLDPVDSAQILEYMKNGLSFGYPLNVPRDADLPIKAGRYENDLDYVGLRAADSPSWVDPVAYQGALFVAPTAFAESHPSWQQGLAEMRMKVQEELQRWLGIVGKESTGHGLNRPAPTGEKSSLDLLEEESTGPDLSEMIRDLAIRYSDYNQGSFFADVRLLNDSFCSLRSFLPDEIFGDYHDTRDLALGQSYNRLDGLAEILVPNLPKLSIGLGRHLRCHLDRLVYLGPLRASPERDYLVRAGPPRRIEPTGRRFADLLARRPELVERTNEVLAAFGIGYRLRLSPVAGAEGEEVSTLRLVDERTGTVVSVRDVGFGVSQVLPIIVQSLWSERNVVLIEQPETHLHPRLQAELGSLFADAVAAPRENQFIVETHSEHLVLRLQRLVRQGRLKASDISIVYVSRGERGSQCVPLRLDAEGDFVDAWPEGFFEEGYREIFDLPDRSDGPLPDSLPRAIHRR